MIGRTVTYIVTPIPMPAFSLSTTIPSRNPHLHITDKTLNNFSTIARAGLDDGGVDVPPTPLSLLWLDASPSTTVSSQTSHPSSEHHTTFPPWPPPAPTPQTPASTHFATVVVTVTPTPTVPVGATSISRVPTEYLSQVPRGWPYTEFGVGRRNGVETWGLTDGEGRTVAEVRHRVLWWPRPLWSGGNVTGLLERWRPTFAMPEGYDVPSAVSSFSGPSPTSSSRSSGSATTTGSIALTTSPSVASAAVSLASTSTLISTTTSSLTTEVTPESSFSSCAIVTGVITCNGDDDFILA